MLPVGSESDRLCCSGNHAASVERVSHLHQEADTEQSVTATAFLQARGADLTGVVERSELVDLARCDHEFI